MRASFNMLFTLLPESKKQTVIGMILMGRRDWREAVKNEASRIIGGAEGTD